MGGTRDPLQFQINMFDRGPSKRNCARIDAAAIDFALVFFSYPGDHITMICRLL